MTQPPEPEQLERGWSNWSGNQNPVHLQDGKDGQFLNKADHRIFVTGATGLLGRQVMKIFAEHGWQVQGLGFSRASGAVIKCNLLDPVEMEAKFVAFKPRIVIHCAAERRPDVLEKDKDYATRINVQLTRDLGLICAQHGAWMVNMSTNYVFDGKDAPYAEDAVPHPINTYGESKYAAEKALAEVYPDAASLRVPLLYGQIETLEETSVTALVNTIKGSSPKLDNWQERFPTHTTDVARVLEAFCSMYAQPRGASASAFSGIFHWQSNERYTKWTMAIIIAEIVGLDLAGCVRVDNAPAPGQALRPQFEQMLCTRLETLLRRENYDISNFRTDFQTNLRAHLTPFLEGAPSDGVSGA
jgi:S-adenosylmethionine synthetase